MAYDEPQSSTATRRDLRDFIPTRRIRETQRRGMSVQKPKLVHPKTGEEILPLYVDRYGRPRYPIMGASPDDPDDDGDEDDSDDDDEDGLDPDTKVKVGDRTFKVSELQTIMAREKRQGKNSGQKAALKTLGFDSLEDAQAFVSQHRKPADDGGKGGDDEAQRRVADRERQAEERDRKARARERRADLRSALRDAGCPKDDLDDALVLLDRAVDTEYDDDDLDDAVTELRDRRPSLFGTEDDEDDKDTPPKRTPRAPLPQGGGNRRRHTPQKVFGAGGLERAKRKGWVKD